jgi:2-C-methyl-D-erythritol 4-phosphate cytidylyltransferase
MTIKQTRFHVVIPCAGSGSRSGLNIPKQYAILAGRPLVLHTLRNFDLVTGLGHAVVVVSPEDRHMQQFFDKHPQDNFQIFNTGGKTRAESVLAGLRALEQLGVDQNDWVLIHDAARCLITPELIEKLVSACENDAVGGLLALPLPDTLKSEKQGRVSQTLARDDKWLAQTPQMFRLNLLIKALTQAGEAVTDEASAIEALGISPLLVKGAAFNFKVTYLEDSDTAESILIDRQKTKEKR